MPVTVRPHDPRIDHLDVFEHTIHFGAEALRQLSANLESSLLETHKALEIQVEDYYGEGTGIAILYNTSDEMMLNELQQQQRYGHCLSIYSFFEGRLKAICEAIEKKHNYKIKVKDLSGGTDLMRYHNYLTKVLEADLSTIEQYFTPINKNKEVRNVIAHQDGLTKNGKLAESIGNPQGFAQWEEGESFRVVLTGPEYTRYLLDKMELCLNELLKIVVKRTQELL
jgi:hypothetical protein